MIYDIIQTMHKYTLEHAGAEFVRHQVIYDEFGIDYGTCVAVLLPEQYQAVELFTYVLHELDGKYDRQDINKALIASVARPMGTQYLLLFPKIHFPRDYRKVIEYREGQERALKAAGFRYEE